MRLGCSGQDVASENNSQDLLAVYKTRTLQAGSRRRGRAAARLHGGVHLVDDAFDELQAERLHEQELHAIGAQLGARRDLAQRDGALLCRQAARERARAPPVGQQRKGSRRRLARLGARRRRISALPHARR